ncbi:MAG: tetratricopeptide repeat protein, partial [Gammaproteobacteria bacterium]|nr:tetratricopeptide repeat protein [Gammaproteobacteria bacterium]
NEIEQGKDDGYDLKIEADNEVLVELKESKKIGNNLDIEQNKKKKDYYVQDSDALRELINKSNNRSVSKKAKYRKRLYLFTAFGLLILIMFYGYQLVIMTGDIVDIKAMQSTNELGSDPGKGIAEKNKVVERLTENSVIDRKVEEVSNSAPVSKRSVSKKVVSKRGEQDFKKKIMIKHEIKTDPIESNIVKAYDLFQIGKYSKSRDMYEQVIISEPDNRDALLGLAAIAIKNKDIELASDIYKVILYLNPKDSIAHSGLTGLVNNNSDSHDESRLKLLIKQQPSAGHLYFSLATIYAGQKKWADAQKEFFNAWSRDRVNPDYAFNLAISLDHLNKQNEAKEFYRLSLDLASERESNFSKEDVLKRLSVIEKTQ